MKDYDKAKENFKTCLEIHNKTKRGDSMEAAAMINNLGLVFEEEGEYSEATEYYEKGL